MILNDLFSVKKKLFHQNLKQIQDIEIGNLHSLTKNVYFLFSVYFCFSILGQLNSAINIEIIRIAKLLKTSQSFNAMTNDNLLYSNSGSKF